MIYNILFSYSYSLIGFYCTLFVFHFIWIPTLIVGFSILSMKRWGHTIFKCYLYLLFLAIPIGTYISYKTLKYMEARRISELYD